MWELFDENVFLITFSLDVICWKYTLIWLLQLMYGSTLLDSSTFFQLLIATFCWEATLDSFTLGENHNFVPTFLGDSHFGP